MISIIAAVGKNLELGKNNDLIWHIKSDLKNFKELTMNKYIVMGTNTFNSLPKHLDGRKYIVLSHCIDSIDDGIVFNNFTDLLEFINKTDEEVMIIGGASIYRLFLPYADNLYLTEIADEADADVYFPAFDKSLYEKTVLKDCTTEDIPYQLVEYKKKR